MSSITVFRNQYRKIWALGDIHGGKLALDQVLERSGFDNENDLLVFLGDVCDGFPETKACIEKLMSIKNLVHILGNHDCLDEETEVFTERGWLKYYELKETDKVLGINTQNKTSQWQSIIKIIIKKSDHLNYYFNKSVDFAITDNHRIIFQKKTGEYDYITPKNLKFSDRIKIPLGCSTSNKEFPLTDNEIKLTAWILTDGGIDKYGYVKIYQSKEENLGYLHELISDLNLAFSSAIRQRNTEIILNKKIKSCRDAHEFYFNNESSAFIREKLISSKKIIPNWCYNLSQRQLEIFLKEIIRGDGSVYHNKKENYILYGTYSFLSDIQPIFNIAGYSANITKSNRNDFRLNISKNNTIGVRQDLQRITRKEGEFNVWCLNVPFSNFLVRRNNKSYFTGNCWVKDYYSGTMTKESDPDMYECWFQQGGQSTLDSYPDGMPADHLEFLKRACHYVEIAKTEGAKPNKIMTHGGFNASIPIQEQDSSLFCWNRDLVKLAFFFRNQPRKMSEIYDEIYVGHTPTISFNSFYTTPQNWSTVWNVDTGSAYIGKLSIMDIDTKEFFQSEEVRKLYPDHPGRNALSWNKMRNMS